MTAMIGANLTRTWTATQLANDGSAPGKNDVYADSAGKRYRFVVYNSGTGSVAAVAGKAAYMYGTAASSSGEVDMVTMDLTDSVGSNALVAGLFMSAPGNGEYGWIQTWGPATFAGSFTSGGTTDGIQLRGPVTAGTDGDLTQYEIAGSGVALSTPCGNTIDASAKLIFLRCA